MADEPSSSAAPFSGKIGIIGSGALGLFYGARLARAGSDVHFLLRSDYPAVSREGIHIRSVDGDFHLPTPNIYDSAQAMGPCDLLLIALKTTQNAALEGLLAPTTHPDTLVLTLQNGLGNEEAIARALGHQGERLDNPEDRIIRRILGGVAFICSTREAPGHVDHTAHGWIRMAQFRGAPLPQTHAVAQAFVKAGIHCQVYDHLLRARWEKLIWNIPFNGLGVAAQAHTAKVLSDPDLTRITRALMEEALVTARADGAELPVDLPERMINNTREMGEYKSSMQLDYEAGRPLEVESIVTEPLRRARKHGIKTPHIDMLNALLQSLTPD